MDKAKKAKDETAIKAEMEELQKIINQSAAKGIRHGNFSGSADSQTIRDALKKNKLIEENPDDVIIDGQSQFDVTGAKTGQKYAITSSGEVIRICKERIGDAVGYSTSMNEVTLDNWKVFYKEIKNGTEYVYFIYGDYFPYNAVSSISELSKGNSDYMIKSTNRANLLNALTTKSNWKDLLKGAINGNSIDYSNVTNDNIYAIGSPTIELWVNSWNKSYPSDKIFIRYEENVKNNNYDGWYVSLNNPANAGAAYLSQKIGYSNKLYYPYTNKLDSCEGYWLSSPSVYNNGQTVQTRYTGVLGYYYGADGPCSIRPVICLPSSVLE
ncbi:MAG: hypothetical protein IJJ82_08135 [Clostridia bacterium]|nr:hypothetical protein [Clostridia bacterium]